jgi:hypothetical protein
MTKDAQAIILEAQALETMSDYDAFDAWVSSLSDDEFVLYQTWQRDRLFIKRARQAAEAFGKVIEAVESASRAFATILEEAEKRTQAAALELLEKLADYAEVAADDYYDWRYGQSVEHVNKLARISRYATFALPDDSHYAITKMKPLKQYAARR